jgi:hypothetical protein
MTIRNNWTLEEISAIFNKPLLDLIYEAATVHRENKAYAEVQVSSLISIKTGGCQEDCAYCPQAARYHTDVEVEPLMSVEKVKARAEAAKANGASRLCMGAAWREVRDNSHFDRVLDVNVRGVVHGVLAAYPIMVRQGSGHIVNVASLAGLGPAPLLTAYATSKHAVVGLGPRIGGSLNLSRSSAGGLSGKASERAGGDELETGAAGETRIHAAGRTCSNCRFIRYLAMGLGTIGVSSIPSPP